jgi:hypothetical protein
VSALPRTVAVVLFATAGAFHAAPKPVPRMQAIPQPDSAVSFQRDGVELTRYHHGAGHLRPFLFPLVGPSGRSVTRLGHPRDPVSHSHHNSVWISHFNVAGADFWGDPAGNRIVQRKLERLEDADDRSFIEVLNEWRGKDGNVLLTERRRISVQHLENAEWMLLLDLQLEAGETEIKLGETAFGPIGVRMAKTIGVHDGGGTIRNSEGGVDEAGCFRKPARWVDYSGPMTATASEGVALFDHPSNPNHPVPFHVRNDGWMGAALTFPGAITVRPAEPLRLRYGLLVHRDVAPAERIEAQWASFAKSPWVDFGSRR